MTTKNFDTVVIDDRITGYLPHSIYAFETNTHPNHLKIGDTNRKVETRLKEWGKVYPDLIKKYEAEAMLEDEYGEKTIFFRDHAVHEYLLTEKNLERLSENQYEREFFKYATVTDVENGINDIKAEFIKEGSQKYKFYQVGTNNSQVEMHWHRKEKYPPRPNQEEVIKNIVSAVKRGQKNLLLYAVMRFGKSNVAIWAAKELNSRLTVIVTGKADVKTEWQKTVESHEDFENFVFTDSTGFTEKFINENIMKNIVVFTTLQDLAGSQENIKEKHTLLFDSNIEFLVIDESHFGARAQTYSKALINKEDEEFDELKDADFDKALENINSLNSNVKLHLSGTPYRILLSGEFSEADIVGKVQFTDILEKKNEWISDHVEEEEEKPWGNPYFGFPEMVRFAFTPNKSSIELLSSLKEKGESAELNVLFAPESTAKNKANKTKFTHEADVLNLLKAIDGSEEDENIFPFLDYQKIKEGKLAQHMVFVLPFKNSADAMERLLLAHKDNFKNLGTYQILNVAGNTSKFRNVTEVQNKIKEQAEKNQKTLTLTVNKMLTGSTVPEWNTMVFLKDTKSPQDYDQAIFRLQSPWIKKIKDIVTGEIIGKEDMKPQTLLIDFSPNRMFKIESERALVVNASEGKSGNDHQEEQLRRSVVVSPIIYLNRNKLVEATPTDIIAKIRDYSADKSIIDEVVELPIDESLYNIPDILAEISSQSELGSKSGFEISANEEGDTNLDGNSNNPPDNNGGTSGNQQNETGSNSSGEDNKPTAKQMQMYYSRILFYAFLSHNEVKNLTNIIESIDINQRLAHHLGLRKSILEGIKTNINPFILATLDNKIENIGDLRKDADEDDILKAIAKFGRISSSEVFTPIWVARMMVDKLMDEKFVNDYKENPKNIFDLSTKSGVYLIMAYQKLIRAGIDKDVLKNKLFAVATSHVGYEFTRAVYEEFGWNIENIVNSDDSTSYQFIVEESVEKKLKELFGDENLKFDVIIGNPPFQEKDGGAQASSTPLYQKFVRLSKELNPEVISLVLPTRWYVGGKGLDEFRDKMLNDRNLKELHDWLTPEDVFPNTNIRGGVCYFLWDRNYDNELSNIRVVNYENNIVLNDSVRPLKYRNSAILVRDTKALPILDKIINDDFSSIQDIISARNPFKFATNFVKDSKFKNSKDELENPIKCYANKGKIGYVELEQVTKNVDWVDKWKVLTPYSNNIGTELKDDNMNTIISEPNSICTETYLVIGANLNLNLESSESLSKYLKTTFVRFLLSLAKNSQHGTRGTYRFVPMQDFDSKSIIDWKHSIEEIDNQLFSLYNLDIHEIAHIKNRIKEM